MTYSERVKAGKEIISRMEALQEDGEFTFVYKGQFFSLKCYSVYDDGRRSYAVDKAGAYGHNGMNVEEVGPTKLSLYTFDMMGKKSTYRMDMSLIEVMEHGMV